MILYRLIQWVLIPTMVLRALWAVLRGGESMDDLRERMIGPAVAGPAIWVHGASIGELASARAVLVALARDSGFTVLVTATRKPAVQTVSDWQIDGIVAGLAPLDSTWITRRMITRCGINRLISLENELWPARMQVCHARDVPVVMLSARMSDRSARIWARLPRLAQSLLAPVRWVIPQDAASARNLVRLGVDATRVGDVVKLKSSYVAGHVDIPDVFAGWSRDTTVLAAATHADEEEIALNAFRKILEINANLRMIIAPRHAERGDDVARLIVQAGFDVARHSNGDAPKGQVFLADTTGEMALWYTLASAAFIGGSLVPKGGHTPYEPAAHGCAILQGPHLRNFTEDYALLHRHDAALAVSDAETLARGFLDIADNRQRAINAKNAVQPIDIKAISRTILNA